MCLQHNQGPRLQSCENLSSATSGIRHIGKQSTAAPLGQTRPGAQNHDVHLISVSSARPHPVFQYPLQCTVLLLYILANKYGITDAHSVFVTVLGKKIKRSGNVFEPSNDTIQGRTI